MFCSTHFCSLLRKEVIVMWRTKMRTIVEIILPLLISLPVVILVIQNSSTVKREEQLWRRFRVTGDWRDVDRRLGNIHTIYSYCKMLKERNLGLVFPRNVDKNEILWTANEIESRYSINSSVLHAHDYKLNVKVFPTKDAMMDALMEDYQQSIGCTKYIAGIIFDEYNRSTSRLSYTMRIRQTDDPQTRWYIGDDIWESGGPYEILNDELQVNMIPNYWSLGFLSLQYAIDSVFLKGIDNQKYNDSNFEFFLERIPEPPHFEKSIAKFLFFLEILWQLFVLPCVLHTVGDIVSEKQCGMKAFLKVMGVQSSTFYMVHALIAYIKIMLVLLPCAVVLLPQFQTVHPLLLICTNVVYGAGAISFSVLMSCVFHNPAFATKGTTVIWLATIGLSHFGIAKGSILLEIIFSLNINYAFTCSLEAVQDFMNRDDYLNFYNMFTNATYMLPIGLALMMMICDVLWMSMLAVYLDNVYPSGDLPRKHWFYFLRRSNNGYVEDTYDMSDMPNDNLQSRVGNDQADIDIRHLTKNYTVQPAVDNMTFRAYRGEITVLLGHNGAGKSTTFSMLAGLIAPTSGSIYICGNRMEPHSIDHCLQEIGFCPQYNALFHLLTVREHLEMFRELSGNTIDSVDKMMADIQLEKEADVIGGKLSGGMKRKLCVGISLIGGRRVVLLDEPTAGMDLLSRRTIGRLLERYKRDRTILLTTHYMEEADSLGDRIAIMVRGKLVCAGTSEFLKNRFGTGFLLSIDLMNRSSPSAPPHFCTFLLNSIKKYIPKAEVQLATSQQVTLLLPTESKKSFPSLFAHLEENAEKYNISSFGLSLNTLEQVFLRVEELGIPYSATAVDVGDIKQHAALLCSESNVRKGAILWFGQFHALLRKRFICQWRQWSRLIGQILLPQGILLLATIYIKNLSSGVGKKNEILLNAGRISPSVVPIHSKSQDISFAFNVQRVVQNMANYLYELVPSSQNMESYLVHLPKKPPPVSVAVACSGNNHTTVATTFFNAKARYGPVIATTLISNARLGISADSIKLSFSPYGNVSSTFPLVSLNLLAPFLVTIFAFISSGFVTSIVDDIHTKFMYQLLHTRLSAFTYWLSVLVSDISLYAFTCIVSIGILITWLGEFRPDLVLLWFMYLWPALPFTYCMAFLFKRPARAHVALIIITLVVSLCAVAVSSIMMSLKPELFPYLHIIFLFTLPTYAMSYGLILILVFDNKENIILVADVNQNISGLYGWENLGRVYCMMFCSGLLFWFLLFIINSKPVTVYMHRLLSVIRWTKKCGGSILLLNENRPEDDDDVAKERERVLFNRNAGVPLVVHNLNKYYGNLHAVRDLTFCIENGECFGLLGVNGAGKTTTFDMLAGVSIPDYGEALIYGRSVLKKQIIGFCPQFDALHPHLTAVQTLELFASLHGYVDSAKRVQAALKAVCLESHADVCVKFLSGGQRRRLSLAVALISLTKFVLLDEPTAGIDPKTRRQIWNLVSEMGEERRAVLLTSHSMDECEALCHRIGIMDEGTLIAMGTPQHIKTKFGEKYTLSIMTSDVRNHEELIRAVREIFPDSEKKENTYQTNLLWDIKRKRSNAGGREMKWSEMYRKLCQLAEQYPWIIDYSLTQGSLEEAFMRRLQRNEKAAATSTGCVS